MSEQLKMELIKSGMNMLIAANLSQEIVIKEERSDYDIIETYSLRYSVEVLLNHYYY